MGASRSQSSDACLGTDPALAFAEGHLHGHELSSAEAHIARCVPCRRLVSNVATALSRAPSRAGSADSTPPPGAPPASPHGAVVGRYVIAQAIGAGGMGVVYEAYDDRLGRNVALKALRGGNGRPAEGVLVREARAMALLAHPNVVRVYDLVVDRGTMFVAMELVRGSTLKQWLCDEPRSWREIVSAFVEAGRGLAAAHAVGIVHRDFKPENVLRAADGRICVSDFGLSRVAAPARRADAARVAVRANASGVRPASSAVGGTPRYMAPEQRRGDEATAQSDQFSFCVALYEALYGEPPLLPDRSARPGPTTKREMAARKIPAWLRGCLLRGLRERPEERYENMATLLRELERARGGHRWTIALALLMTAVAAVGFVGWNHTRAARARACAHPEAAFSGIWDAARAEKTSAPFVAAGIEYSTTAWVQVRGALDRYASNWATVRGGVCQDVVARGGPLENVATDPRVVCLDERLREAKAVIDEMAELRGTGQLDQAVIAVQSLQAPDRCKGARTASYGPPPSTPSDAAGVLVIQTKLARALALGYLQRRRDAAALAIEARELAEPRGEGPLLAQALFGEGKALCDIGKRSLGRDRLHRAVEVADAAGDDTTRVRAWGVLTLYSASDGAALSETTRDFEHGMAALQRIGGDDPLEAHLRAWYATALSRREKFAEARAQLEQALLHCERGGLDEQATLGQLGATYAEQGELTLADQSFERALRAEEEALGPKHPILAYVLNDWGELALQRLDFEQGLARTRRSSSLLETMGPREMPLAVVFETTGRILLEMGRSDEALAILLRAFDVQAQGEPSPTYQGPTLTSLGRVHAALGHHAEAVHDLELVVAMPGVAEVHLADARFALARELATLHREPKRARDLARQAREWLESLPKPTPLQSKRRDEVRAWLAAHPERARDARSAGPSVGAGS